MVAELLAACQMVVHRWEHGDLDEAVDVCSAALVEQAVIEQGRPGKEATAETFSGDHPDGMHRDDLECAIGDLICDLLHLADQKGFDPQAILEQGNAHFKTELLLDD